MDELDFNALVTDGEWDRATVEKLKKVDLEEVRATLSQFLPDAQVARILERIRRLIGVAPCP